jgi:hypothetical protein
MLILFLSWLIIFSSCSSVISKPAPINISSFFSFISLPIYFPIICSLAIEIEFKPFSLSFFAIIIFNFSPALKTVYYFLHLLNHKKVFVVFCNYLNQNLLSSFVFLCYTYICLSCKKFQ